MVQVAAVPEMWDVQGPAETTEGWRQTNDELGLAPVARKESFTDPKLCI